MASLALHLRNHRHKTSIALLRFNSRSNLIFSHLFSSSSSSSSSSSHDDSSNNYRNSPKTSNSSYFKSKLRDQLQQEKQHPKKSTPTNAFDVVHETLRRLSGRGIGKSEKVNDRLSWNTESFKMSTPMAESRKRGEEGKRSGGDHDVAKTEVVRLYDNDESGKQLREPRPEITKTMKKGEKKQDGTSKKQIAAVEESDSKSKLESELTTNDEKANEAASKEQMASSRVHQEGKKRRRWTKEETDALIEVVRDLMSSGSFEVSDFYDPDFLNSVEETLKVKLPESGLKVHPHILSRIHYLRDVLGFKIRRYCTKEEVVTYLDHGQRSSDGPPERIETSIGASISNEDWARKDDDLAKGLSIMASILGKEIRASGSEISRAMEYAVMLSEKRSRINDELSKLGLPLMDRHRATRKIASKPATVDIFFSIPDAEKKEWVQTFLHGLI